MEKLKIEYIYIVQCNFTRNCERQRGRGQTGLRGRETGLRDALSDLLESPLCRRGKLHFPVRTVPEKRQVLPSWGAGGLPRWKSRYKYTTSFMYIDFYTPYIVV